MATGHQTPVRRPIDIYARRSRKGDKRQRSTGGQVQDCTVRLTDLGHPVGKVFVDEGKSAWDPRVKRRDWTALMERLESGVSGGVIVFDMERFSRRPIEGERLIQAAERGLVVLDSEQDYDLTSADGKAQFRDQMKMAAYYSDRLSTKVKRGKRLKAMKGESNHATRPFGFEPDGVTHCEPEASIVRELTARVLTGESQDALVVELNERGVRTSYGKQWSRTSLRQMLTRPRNAGWVEYDGAVVGRMDGDPLVDPEVFDQLVALFLSRRRARPASDKYLCSGIVVCGWCGHGLSGRPRGHLKRYEDGAERREYWCQPRSHDGGCGRIRVDQRALDGFVGELVVARLSDPEHAAALEHAARRLVDEQRRLDGEIADAEHTAEELAGRLGRGEISLRRYDAVAGPLDKRLEGLRAERAAVGTPVMVGGGESAEVWRVRWEEAATGERRVFLRQALQGARLVVGPADPKAPRRFDPARVRVER